jgi:hypothetical protein
MNLQEARSNWLQDKPQLEALGVHFAEVTTYATPESKRDFTLALDAQPSLTTSTSGSIPSILTTSIDPTVFEVRFAPTKAVEAFGEMKKGTWLDDVIMFPTLEHAGEVSSYGDYANNGTANVNMTFPQRQQYLYQIIEEYGQRELERAGLAKINLVAEKDKAAADIMNRFENYAYFFGVQNLQNYGLVNDPALGASLTPSTKAAGGTTWFTAGGAPNATSIEVYGDVLATITQLINQSQGVVSPDDPMVLILSPGLEMALKFVNIYNVKAGEVLKDNFPNLRIVTAIQYGKQSTLNPQGVNGGNFMQVIATRVQGQDTGFCAYSEKMRAFPIIPEMSAFKKKIAGGVWGAIIRNPWAIASMIGI